MIGNNNHTHGFAQESQCTLDHVDKGKKKQVNIQS